MAVSNQSQKIMRKEWEISTSTKKLRLRKTIAKRKRNENSPMTYTDITKTFHS